MSIFSERLRKLRKEKKLSQQQIADILNINRGSYSNWELGKREPDFDKVKELAKILGTSTDYLLGAWIFAPSLGIGIDGRKVGEEETETEEISRDIKYQFIKWVDNILVKQSSSSLEINPIENRIAYLEEVKKVINNEFKLNENNNFFNEIMDNAIQKWENFSPTFGNNLETTHPKSNETDDNEKY
ncbi:helix-turn-helix domain-containing protein [Lactococcus lactis]|uniref:helix-turn-helix domain-containing protein n=1 Tax=Lactococcus lactis TaxID=1358 RepID=UPI000C9FBCE9|nr:helix-turn-helix transcriptional regulator [Lactococcus lactis]AUS68782.1 hypothetical protein LLG50_01290 [Lactococcus lactis subsp. lactis]